jgi:PTS system fructose-specific IIC component
MELSAVLNEKVIIMDLESKTKPEIINELVEVLYNCGKIKNREMFVKSVLDREKLGSTGIGKGIAIPHGKVEGIEGVVVALGLSRNGVEFDSLDDKPVHSVFLIAANPDNSSHYLKTLAKLSRIVRFPDFRTKLMDAEKPSEVIDVILNFEEN